VAARTLDQERAWLRRSLSKQYDAAASSVSRLISEVPGLRGSTSVADVLVDLIAVQVYLSAPTRDLDDAVRAGQAGPHVPIARCVGSGLRRLPSYRGVTRTCVTLSDAEWDWYGDRRLVTEWSFLPALTSGRGRLPGSVDFLIWSMTARRTNLLVPDPPDQVVFLPGTSFKVLGIGTTPRRQVLLRELSAAEVGADGQVAPGRGPLDELALSELEDRGGSWLSVEPTDDLPKVCARRFAAPPGLLSRPLKSPPAGDRRPEPTLEGRAP
jgi:hypothetical protein